jgi:hypothetical protein
MTEETTTNTFAEPLVRAKIAGELEQAIKTLKLTPDMEFAFNRALEIVKGRR